MGSSHPDDVDQLLVPGDPGSPDGTAGLPDEPADWDDAWLPEWLDGETDPTPPVEDAASGPEPDVALGSERDVALGPEPDVALEPDRVIVSGLEPDVALQPEPDAEPGGDVEAQPDAEPRPDLEPEPEDEPDAEAGPDADAE